jgi:hypothetical protein
MVLCVRNEEDFLAAHLAYHHALGVAKAYVFLDRCTDASPEIARSFPWVEPVEQDRDPADRFMSMHQVKCLNSALERARADGFEWLMHVDADEFACGDTRPEAVRLTERLVRRGGRAGLKAGHLPTMLAGVAPTTEMVVIRPRDVIPTPVAAGAPFWKLHYFQRRGMLRRPVLDPTTGAIQWLENPLGHDKGKSIVRTTADVEAETAHRWRRRVGTIRSEYRGSHYHFVVVDAAHWLAKHRKFAEYPDHWQSGAPVKFPKRSG